MQLCLSTTLQLRSGFNTSTHRKQVDSASENFGNLPHSLDELVFGPLGHLSRLLLAGAEQKHLWTELGKLQKTPIKPYRSTNKIHQWPNVV